MNRVTNRNLCLSLNRNRGFNYGWWWNDEAGKFRRPSGQGPAQHKKYDHLKFTDNPKMQRNHPYLQWWIRNRIRDQERGLRILPYFPDFIFYLKFFILLPLALYYSLETYKSRAYEELDLKKSLVRDLELERTFYKRSSLDIMLGDFVHTISIWIGKVLSAFSKQASAHEAESNNYSEFVRGHHDYIEDQKHQNKFLLSFPRAMYRSNGDHSMLLYFYGVLPLRALSECAGYIANCRIPIFLREILYGTYSKAFGVNMSEALEEDFRYYPTINSFFRRALKDGARPIDEKSLLVSPADGKVLHVSKCENGYVEQVKGVDYSIRRFLGRADKVPLESETESDFVQSLKIFPDSEFYQIVIYLAPGDYHRFHSSNEFLVKRRRYYPGDLFSVNPKLANYMKDLFVLNERATLIGEWPHGFFSYCAVGATNVGSIIFHYDPDLVTNIPGARFYGTYQEKDFTKLDPRIPEGLPIHKGEMVGEFNLGSTIVLVFEAPKDFEFCVTPGETVRVGQPIGNTSETKQ